METKIDDITYEMRIDNVTNAVKNVNVYIRAGYPRTYITDNMTKREANKVAKSMRQLGFTVIDKTKA